MREAGPRPDGVELMQRSLPEPDVGQLAPHQVRLRTDMHGRTGGAPSNRRFRLFYYYVRLVVVLLSSARRRSTRDASREARR